MAAAGEPVELNIGGIPPLRRRTGKTRGPRTRPVDSATRPDYP
ncbi:hypothetical protein PJI17_17985 [Mycobacterium kansasii]|nr:hypothetical protein I547_6697 [Mycobacterium kansasii 824]